MTSSWYKKPTRRLSDDIIQLAGSIGAASLYEANSQQGALDPVIHQIAPKQGLNGSALTVRCQSGDNLTLHAAVAVAKPGDVIVADVGDFADAGHWGEILTVAAQARGVAGLVINGGVRDAAALGTWHFPVYARALSMKATTKQIRGMINHPIVCGGVHIEPGDLIVADEDGVVAIAYDVAQQVVAEAQTREAREAELMGRLREGALTVDLLGIRERLGAGLEG